MNYIIYDLEATCLADDGAVGGTRGRERFPQEHQEAKKASWPVDVGAVRCGALARAAVNPPLFCV